MPLPRNYTSSTDLTRTSTRPSTDLRRELTLVPAAAVGLLAFFFEHAILEMGAAGALAGAAVLIAAIITVSVRVAHHAEVLAAKVGDPFGSMILTISAVVVEVIILVILMTGSSSPTLARDTIFSAVMLDLNGILGLAALLGGWKFGEQPYNDNSGKTYGAMILTAMGISMVVPEFVPQDRWQFYSGFTILAMATLYWVFVRNQVGPHSYFFSYSYPEKKRPNSHAVGEEPLVRSVLMLVLGIGLIGLLAEVMSLFLTTGHRGGRGAVGAGRSDRCSHVRGSGDPDRLARGLVQPDAGRDQHRAGGVPVDSHPDGAGDRGDRPGYRSARRDGDDTDPNGHGLDHPHHWND